METKEVARKRLIPIEKTIPCVYAGKHKTEDGSEEKGCFLATSSCTTESSSACEMCRFKNKKILVFKRLLMKHLETYEVLSYDEWYIKIKNHFQKKCFIPHFFLLRAEDEVIRAFSEKK